ncbi:hypothetical protein Q9966_013899 [Columba livia]|nr:hypothetical protein Q9966_013899 [Columba livia]
MLSPHSRWWEKTTEVVKESVPGISSPQLFVLFSLAPGGTNRRRRWLPWSFVRRRTSDAAEAAKPSGSGHTGVLFGRPLAALCSQDGSLPQLIQDLLALLQEHGPSTEGIFRLAAGERATRELREALDSGAQVQLESQPVHLLAAILKEFLRKIPSKLLQAELYQDWMSALHNTSRQERLAGLKELVQRSSHHLWSPPAAKVELAPRLDLLALLQEHGPSTEGIFRLAAGERATRELREALDSGAQVQLESQPVHLLAAILKEFLRKIPSKLLQAELYQDWMSALHNTSRQERLAGLKELVQRSSHHLWSPPAAKVELAPRLLFKTTEVVKESVPGISSPQLFVLFSLAPGGTNRRRRWLPWSFVRRRTSDAAEAAKPSGSGHTGVLIGQPLAALCSQDSSLPQLIQDLLALLQEHGPSTEGIFRLAAGERATRELREALDSGAQVQLESQPVHLLAAILKEFLRKIPSKLLQAELYQDWMSALHNTSRQERLAGLKELVQRSSHHLWSPPAAKVELAPRLDLLALLQEHGPSTEGIFRLAAGERATRELREALDSGAQVQLESQPVHLLAAILKEFLRKIPSKLLQAELYQDWMSALHNTSRQERLAGLKELVQRSSHHLWSPPAAKVELAPWLDLLALLQEHGPSTEGIFRLAAGERATRELREALDSGAQVQLESQPVHLLAAILKEFLRKIPSKLLQAELYQDWMSALHNTSRQERLAGLKELVQRSSHHLWSPPAAKVELAPRLDLLALLQEHGPSTEGIFRLAAGERATRELREALDSGAQVQLESQPVHLLAAILKEFLRKIPSKLLQAELYQDWMSALHNTSRQERLAGLKELVQRSSHHLWSPPAAKVELAPRLDLLALLQEHGPSTEGIFRLAAGERATRELREALDSGAQVQLESQPVHLLAAILKEFLRKIPSKLLQAELYQDWMSALHNTSRQERLAGLKELVQRSSHHLWSPPAAKVELAPRLDLLALLQEHGPSTEGIFRLAAGERATRELREALDSGAQVQLESQPVHLLAAILKEFLRKIPSKLLQAELYQDWMSALHNTSRQERLAGLKELVQRSSHHLWSPPAAKVELAPRLDLLALLQEHGPSTEGIFRLAAGERATRELREALDSGAQVQLESQPVHLLAAILKEFLRKIPSKLLQAELYQDWMSALHNTSRQERLAGLKELVQRSSHHLWSPPAAKVELAPRLDLLALLQEHGPSTEGIFRLAAGERATRELREALDSGAQVQLESQPVHLLAAILKEFLRKIPSKLLQAELYQDWMSALHNTSRQERLAGLKEVGLLPQEQARSSSHQPAALQKFRAELDTGQAGAEKQPPPLVSSSSEGGVGPSAGGTNRRRRWLPWSFVRRRTSDAAEAAKPSGSGHTGVLFGRPLAALCSQDGSLPQLIQDLLALLQEHGPSTEGIFRLAAGERATRELREALDSGAQVQLESQPVHLLAAILKEFLRKIPSKLLQAELYQDWMSALHNTSRQERLAGLKELVQRSSHHPWSPPAAKVELAPRLDLLALLQEHGPSTEGIFRLAAGERATRELREALDSGAQVQLESQPVHLLAAILKEFLRKIPSKLLQAELYQDWMSALHNTSRQERLAGLKEVGLLPQEQARSSSHQPAALQKFRAELDTGQAGAEKQPPPLVSSSSEGGVGPSAGGTNRRRRWLPWSFVRRRTSDAAEAAKPPGSGHTGVLFGRPLAALCSQDGSLPQLIQDLLALLQEHGPSTEGIFRLAAGERATRELREALDSGAQVQLESQPVHLLAAILKEFLRKIPSKLLQAELYQDWMSALHNTSRQERLAGLKEVGLLPQEQARSSSHQPAALQKFRAELDTGQAGAEKQPPPLVSSSSEGGVGPSAGGTNRRRRWLPWSFVRRRTSDAAEAAKPPGSGHTGVLFGRPLAALCSQDGSLPQLIQDLLALLQEHGPSTEGIFRLAAGERATRELREALDSGAQVQLESQPVHLLAAILKEFLRKIPSKLLQAELYQDWMSALHNTSRQERLAGLKEVGLLPQEQARSSSHQPAALQKFRAELDTGQAGAEKQPPPLVSSSSEDGVGPSAGGTNRRRRWLPWSFVRRRTSDAAEAAKPSGSGHTGVLFGRPLAALCSQDGSLPQLIQDLLALLQEHGPSTEGIFRLAAGERATRELREALDSGAQVQLESQPVHLLAAILKEFLRKIPSKLLQAELYQDWMSALHNTSRQERLAGLKDSLDFLDEL